MQTRIHLNPVELRGGTRPLVGLCVLEGALLLAAIGWQKSDSLREALAPGRPGQAFLTGIALTAISVLLLSRYYCRSSAAARKAFGLGLAVNLLALTFALAAAEIVLRSIAVQTSDGLRVGGVTLPPTWDETRSRNAAVIKAASGVRENWLSYVVGDPDLGWTVGSDRATPDGLYFSSIEGIRSGAPGITYLNHRPPMRIALIGDSYTFSMDVPFEDSWGYRLQQQLGRDVQVLNFGVDGYGVDQAFLRYQRDVRSWRPDIVLFGVIQHDVQRTVAVYPFVSFGWDYPFAKPRFTIDDSGLRLLNTPLIPPGGILAHEDIGSLPFVDYDLGYQQGDWRWRRGDPPLVVRLFGTAFRRWPAQAPAVSDATAADLSGRILEAFRDQVRNDGTAARIIYFPSEGAGDFGRPAPPAARTARGMLEAHAPNYLDLTDCVLAIPAATRLVPGRTHYSGPTNARVAGCIAADLAASRITRRAAPPL